MESSGVVDPNGSASIFSLDMPLSASVEATCDTTCDARPAAAMFSPHGHVLIELARDKHVQIAEIADRLGLEESDVRRIVGDLIASGATVQITVDQQPEYVITAEPSLAQGAIERRATRAVDRLYGRPR